MGDRRVELFGQLEKAYREAGSFVQFLAGEASAHELWEKDDLGRQLSALYLRLLQGPVRAVFMGVSSSGKSILMNAVTGVAGRSVVPESADVCSPIPVSFFRRQKGGIAIYLYHEKKRALPAPGTLNQNNLMQWHHTHDGKKTEAQGNGPAKPYRGDSMPYVYTSSERMPCYASLIDTPGLNANQEDTDTLFSLFSSPDYMPGEEKDLPELVFYVTSGESGDNLSQISRDNLRRLTDWGVPPESIFIVYNQFNDVYTLPEEFEDLKDTAMDALAEDMKRLSVQAGGQAMEDEEARAHVLRLNALYGRIHYVGIYNLMDNLIDGGTPEEHDRLEERAEKSNKAQQEVADLRDEWLAQADHQDYLPLIALRDKIDAEALKQIRSGAPLRVLRAADKLGAELLLERCRRIEERANRIAGFVNDQLEQLQDIEQRFRDSFDAEFVEQRNMQMGNLWKLVEEAASAQYKKVEALRKGLENGIMRAKSLAGKMASWAIDRIAGNQISMDALESRFENFLSSNGISPKVLMATCGNPASAPNTFLILVAAYRDLTGYIRNELDRGGMISQDSLKKAAADFAEFPDRLHSSLKQKVELLKTHLWRVNQLAEDIGIHDMEAFFREAGLSGGMDALEAKLAAVGEAALRIGQSEVERAELPQLLAREIIIRSDGQIHPGFSHMEGVLESIWERHKHLRVKGQAMEQGDIVIKKGNAYDVAFNTLIAPLLYKTLEPALCPVAEVRKTFDEIADESCAGLFAAAVEFSVAYTEVLNCCAGALVKVEKQIRRPENDEGIAALEKKLQEYRKTCDSLNDMTERINAASAAQDFENGI